MNTINRLIVRMSASLPIFSNSKLQGITLNSTKDKSIDDSPDDIENRESPFLGQFLESWRWL